LPQTKVLLIDDEVEFGSALAERLCLRDYNALAFSQAGDALNIIQGDPPHVILLDFRMPGMDGIEVLKIIKQMNPSIEVIMLTGHGDTRSIEEVMKNGAFDYIMKPVDIGELILKIDQAKNKRDSIK
jgi:two-component system, OmpR family, response regulator CpxR